MSSRVDRRGSALLIMTLLVVVMAGASFALLQANLAGHREQRGQRAQAHVRYVCQAGLADAIYNLQRGANGTLGTQLNPIPLGTAHYWVTQTNLAADLISLRSTGIDDRSTESMELVVRSVPNTIWRFAAFGKEILHMDSNAHVDSYNSNTSSYAMQALNGAGADQHANSDGDIGSNGDVGLDQNAKVWGDASAGPGHTTTVLGNAVVSGSTTPMSAAMDLPAINAPSYPSSGALTVSSNTTLASGNRCYSNLVVDNNRTLTINGPADVVITNLRLRSGATVSVNPAGGKVRLWVIDNFIMDSNAIMSPTDGKSKNLEVNLLSDNVINPEITIQLDTVDFASNSKLFGTVYAPNAAITINSNFEIFGSMIARRIDLDSHARFHFDEALLDATATGVPTFETVCWREVASL
jgi:hypothetical protein